MAATPQQAPDPSSKITWTLTLPDGSTAENVPDRWFVELASPSQAAGGSSATISAEQDALVKAMDDADIDASVTTRYGELWNGVAVSVEDSKVEKLAALDQVVSVSPVAVVPAPQDTDADSALTQAERDEGVTSPQMLHAKSLTGADVAQSQLGFTGKDVKIGIIDTGVDYDHVEFGGSGTPGTEAPGGDGSTSFPNAKVTGGYDFVGNAFGDRSLPADQRFATHPDDYPDDCNGHGTHVAGIAAAKGDPAAGQIVGVAPDATISAYRVFGCSGSTSSEVLAAAMARAASDGMDVVNMSIGADFMVFTSYPTAVSADALAAKGVITVVSQGNAGTAGRWSMGAPASARNVIAVGSIDNVTEHNYYLTVSTNAGQHFAYSPSSGTTSPVVRDDNTSYPLVAAGAVDSAEALMCQPVASGTFTGKAVIVRRGDCNFHTKVRNAQDAGASVVLLENNTDGTVNANVAGDTKITIPVATITKEAGEAIRTALAADSTLTFSQDSTDFPLATAGRISDFSSWGLNDQLAMKPDVVAPGGRIWSTWPLDHGGPYKTLDGTSMASPHTAGAVALLLQAHPEIKAIGSAEATTAVAWRLHSTATPLVWSQAGGDNSLLEPLARQGAGRLNIDRAIQATMETTPSVMNLGQSADGPVTTTLTLHNHGSDQVAYDLSHVDAVTVTGPSATPTRGTTSPATVSTDGSKVTVPAGGTASIDVTVTAPEGITDGDFYGGWITLTQADGKVARIPFQGVGGNLGSADVLGGSSGMSPYVSNRTAQAVDASYVFGNSAIDDEGMYEDPAFVVYKVDIPVYKAVLEVTPVKADGTLGEPLGYTMADLLSGAGGNGNGATVPQISTVKAEDVGRGDLTYIAWDGSYVNSSLKKAQAPTGSYQLKLFVLPVGEDGNQLDDWATWTSQTVSIDWKTDGYLPQGQLTVTTPEGTQAAASDDDVFTSAAVSSTTSSYTVDLGALHDVSKLQYTPDQSSAQTQATSLTAFVSEDGQSWTQVGSATGINVDKKEDGTTTTNLDPTVLTLDQVTRARYVRFDLVNEQDGATALSVAELRVAGTLTPGETPPPTHAPADPTDGPGDGGDGGAGGAASPGAAGGSGGGGLPLTGVSLGIGVLAIALVAGGVLLVRSRRRA